MNASECFERLTAVRTLGLCTVLAAIAACGGGSGDDDPAGPTTFTIGGSITGLNGTVVLQNNGGNAVTRSANGAFSFTTQVNGGGSYLVTVQTQPSGQNCTVTNGSGTANATVSNVVVTCTTLAPTIGGTVSGLSGTLVLENSQNESLAVRAGSPDFPAFTFPSSVTPGSAYSVTVLQQPPGQTCTMANASGTANNKVTNVAVTCTANTVSVGGTITGLTGTGLVLQNNLADNLPITAAGGANVVFTFPAASKSADPYAVTVLAQPSGQVCSVTANGTGTPVASTQGVAVSCGPFPATITLGGTVTGLTGSLTLRTLHTPQGGAPQPPINTQVTTNGNLPQISIAGGSLYVVDVSVQPSGQTCLVYNYMGIANVVTIASSDITNIDVRCSPNPDFSVGGTITGLTKAGLILAMDVGGVIGQIAAGATTFTFPRRLPTGTEYRLGVLEHPPGMTCTTLNSAGEVAFANVTNVNVTCIDNVTDSLNGVYRLPGRRGYISFNPAGWYLLASLDNTPLPPDPASCGPSRGNGVELGIYDYDAAAGTLAIIANRVDTNGGCGLWDGSATAGIQVQKSGVGQSSVLTLTLGTDSYTLTPAASVPGSLIGAFRQPYAYAFVVFDGTHYVVGDAGGMAEGIEYGCYTTGGGNINASTVTATCTGAVDTNDDAGLTDAGTSSQVPYVVGGQNFLTLGTPPLEGATVWRAIAN